jgi:hypothetical protein
LENPASGAEAGAGDAWTVSQHPVRSFIGAYAGPAKRMRFPSGSFTTNVLAPYGSFIKVGWKGASDEEEVLDLFRRSCLLVLHVR